MIAKRSLTCFNDISIFVLKLNGFKLLTVCIFFVIKLQEKGNIDGVKFFFVEL